MLMGLLCGEFVDGLVLEIFQRVAHLDLHPSEALRMEDGDLRSLVITTHGDYEWIITLSANDAVLHQIAQNMKRGTPVSSEDELAAYTGELFNILCGHLVSGINRMEHKSARFGLPRLVPGATRVLAYSPPGSMRDWFYKDGSGLVLRLRTLLDDARGDPVSLGCSAETWTN